MAGQLLSSRSPRAPLSLRVMTAACQGRGSVRGMSFISSPTLMWPPWSTLANTPSRGMMQSPTAL